MRKQQSLQIRDFLMLKKKNLHLGSLDFHLEMPYRKNLQQAVLQSVFMHRETHLIQPIDLTYSFLNGGDTQSCRKWKALLTFGSM